MWGQPINFIIKMKEKNASNARIANVIASMKWVITKLQERGMAFNQLNLLTIKKPKVMKKETNYLTEEEIGQFLYAIKRDMVKSSTVHTSD